MKKVIKKLLGEWITCKIVNLKSRYFPNKEQKKEIEEVALKRKPFYSKFIKADDLCFDVGANIGNRIVPMLAIGAKVVAIEPQESCYRFLKCKFGKRIEIVTSGLGETESIKEFHISNASTISSFSEDWINSVKNGRFAGYNWDKVVQIEMTTLDRLIERYGQPKFIKIDVEGYELEVLKGLTKPVELISFEYTVPEQINRAIECIEQIEKNSPNIECNYSIGESMTFALKRWKSANEMKIIITTEEFTETGFGDIYVRQATKDVFTE